MHPHTHTQYVGYCQIMHTAFLKTNGLLRLLNYTQKHKLSLSYTHTHFHAHTHTQHTPTPTHAGLALSNSKKDQDTAALVAEANERFFAIVLFQFAM